MHVRVMIYLILSLLGCFSQISAEINFTHRTDPYATHQPVLYEIASSTTGPIIEFGCGYGSTDILHEICRKSGRILISIEDDEEWLNQFSPKYLGDGYELDNSGWHKFYFVPGKKDHTSCEHWLTFFKEHKELFDDQYALTFVDQSPWQARLETIKKFRSISKYIILHDCDFFPEYHFAGKTVLHTDYENSIPGIYEFDDIISHYKLYYPLKPWPLFSGPPTLLGSDFVSDFPEINYENY